MERRRLSKKDGSGPSYESMGRGSVQVEDLGSPNIRVEETHLMSPSRGLRPLKVVDVVEPLYLGSALIVAHRTRWRIHVEETSLTEHAGFIDVAVTGNFEPFSAMHRARIPVVACSSPQDIETHVGKETISDNTASWYAYCAESPPSGSNESSSRIVEYLVSLIKPTQWCSLMKPVRFYFKGVYSPAAQCTWEKASSPAVVLDQEAPRYFERAYSAIQLHRMGYRDDAVLYPVSQPSSPSA